MRASISEVKRLQDRIKKTHEKIQQIQESCPHNEYYLSHTYLEDRDDGYGRWWKSEVKVYKCVDCEKTK